MASKARLEYKDGEWILTSRGGAKSKYRSVDEVVRAFENLRRIGEPVEFTTGRQKYSNITGLDDASFRKIIAPVGYSESKATTTATTAKPSTSKGGLEAMRARKTRSISKDVKPGESVTYDRGQRTVVPRGGERFPIRPDEVLNDPFDLGGATGPTAEELAIRREEIAVQRANALASLATSLLGENLAERQAQRTAAQGLLQQFLPTATNPNELALLGRMFPGIAGGNPLQSQSVPVNVGALAPVDTNSAQAQAAQMAKQILGFRKGGVVSAEKAEKMLEDGTANGKKLSAKQRALFGLIASGKKPTRLQHAQGGTISLDQVTGLQNTLQALIQAIAAAQGLGGLFGSVPANVVSSVNEPFGGREFIRDRSDGKVYSIDEDTGQLRYIPTPGLFAAMGGSPARIREVDNVGGFTLGQPLTGAEALRPRQTFEAKTTLANLASNPRDLFTLLFRARGQETPAPLQGLSTTNAMAGGLKQGALIRAAKGHLRFSLYPKRRTRGGAAVKGMNRAMARYAKGGEQVDGPAMVLVGDGFGGIKSGAAEYALLQPGSVVAPKPKGERATLANASRAIVAQIAKTPGAAKTLLTRAQAGTVALPIEIWQALMQLPGLKELLGGQTVPGLENLQPTAPNLPAAVTQGYRSPLATNFYDIKRLTPLQRGFHQAYISALGIPPEDFDAVSQRATNLALGAPLEGQARLKPRGVF